MVQLQLQPTVSHRNSESIDDGKPDERLNVFQWDFRGATNTRSWKKARLLEESSALARCPECNKCRWPFGGTFTAQNVITSGVRTPTLYRGSIVVMQ